MLDSVTAEDIRRVAGRYFTEDQRNVLIINTKGGREDEEGAGEDPRFAQAVQMITSMQDADRL
jgi:hypothetical protein